MLTAAELTELREVAEDVMPDTCTIQNRTETNTKGSVEITWADTYTSVKCRLMPVGRLPTVYDFGSNITATGDFVLTVPYDQAIAPGDRIVHDSITYEVLGVKAAHSYRTARRADLTRIH